MSQWTLSLRSALMEKTLSPIEDGKREIKFKAAMEKVKKLHRKTLRRLAE